MLRVRINQPPSQTVVSLVREDGTVVPFGIVRRVETVTDQNGVLEVRLIVPGAVVEWEPPNAS